MPINDEPRPQTNPTRRALLLGGLLASAARRSYAIDDPLDAVRADAKKAGLGELRTTKSLRFQGIGDAPSAYQTEALSAAESIANEFLTHFKDRGFTALKLPQHPMLVVVLASPKSFAAFTGEPEDDAVGGHYDVDKNRLVVFDFRRRGRALNAQAELINSRTLAHETVHLLSYNAGMLSSEAQIPAIVNEGIGTYGETWRPKGRGRIGQVNAGWIDHLKTIAAADWIPFERLIADDKAFENPETQAQAYARAWLLTHWALKTKSATPKYLALLDDCNRRKVAAQSPRAAFEARFGACDKVDAELRRYLRRPIGG